ncbi:MAG: hypothetical protein NXY57DRAFT_1041962 [Lentinula lateritia]|nr:MAG: hypothetical protein NXY57DRAFT_1041962 [Lentinula lateritia]
MDPYHNFDHRPLCADHREITLPRKAVNTIDHTNIAPSGGPVRTQKDLPRPPGEVGRPGRGGYSLFEVLSWPRKKYDKVKKFINNLVEDHLDCDVPMSEQSTANVRKVRQQAVEKYIFLKEYSGLWAVDDFIRNHLKYQKSVLRKERLEKIAADARPGAGAEKKGSKRTSSGK